MAISQNFPEEGPTLNLNFAGSKVLDPRITFSRSSVGTYMDDNGLIKTAAADEPRFDHDDVTGESLGLLIEESRTNLIPYSVVNTTNWNSSGQTPVSLSLNALGVFPGVRAISNGQVWHGLYIQDISLTSGTTYTATWYFRKGDIDPSNKFRAIIRDVSAGKATSFEKSSASTDYGDISSYSFSENTDVTTNFEYLSVDTLADGLTYKLCIRFDAAASSDYRFMFQTNSATVGETIIALGLQVEEGEFPTSYIPTSAGISTRGEDRAVIEGTNFTDIFDTSFESFSMFVNYDNLGISTGTNHAVVLFWGESLGYDDRIEFFKDNADPYHIETRAFGGGSGVFANGNLSAGNTAATQKLAMSWSVPDYSDQPSRRWAFSFNGESVDVVNDGSGSTIPAVTRVGFGINPTRTDFHGKRITFKQITLYSNALTDSQLQNLTK